LAKTERVTLVGGPGDGLEYELPKEDGDLQWKPSGDHDVIAARMHGRDVKLVHDPIRYCRSKRTKTLFVYQP
jgi:hypothetical protein